MTITLDLAGLAIDRDSPVPLYFQISELITREIAAAGGSGPETRLPSEPDLARQLDVSRYVVRQALGRLEESGLISRRHGRGSFVASRQVRSWRIEGSAGFFEDELHREGQRVQSKVLRCEEEQLPAWAIDALQLETGSRGITLERLRYVEGLLTVFDLNYLPVRLADPVLLLKNGEHESLYEVLWSERHIRVEHGTRLIDLVLADDQVAELLEVDPQAPLLMVEGVDFDSSHEPFDCYRTWLRPDRMKLEVEVTARPRASKAAGRPLQKGATEHGRH